MSFNPIKPLIKHKFNTLKKKTENNLASGVIRNLPPRDFSLVSVSVSVSLSVFLFSFLLCVFCAFLFSFDCCNLLLGCVIDSSLRSHRPPQCPRLDGRPRRLAESLMPTNVFGRVRSCCCLAQGRSEFVRLGTGLTDLTVETVGRDLSLYI